MAKLFFCLGVLFSGFLFTGNIFPKTSKNGELAKKEVVRENIKKNVAQTEFEKN